MCHFYYLVEYNVAKKDSWGEIVVTSCFLNSEMETVEKLMNEEISFNSTSLDNLIDLKMTDLDKYLCPAIVLAVTGLTEERYPKKTSLAAIFQYVFLAHYIHSLITDEEMPDNTRQFPILVGDFMYGKSFLKICEADLFSYSTEFVKTIETMNEGVIMRWKAKNNQISLQDKLSILEKERASLTALAGKLSGILAGLNMGAVHKLESLGYSLGMAWAVWDERLDTYLAEKYLIKADGIIEQLSQDFNIEPLRDLYECFSHEISSVKLR